MGKILDFISESSHGKFTCYKTKKFSIDEKVRDNLDYDDRKPSTSTKATFAETDTSLVPVVKVSPNTLRNTTPIFRYFLDGSRHTFKIDDIGIGNRIYPIVAGQIIVGCCERKSRDEFKKYAIRNSLVISLPDNVDDDDEGENFCRLYCANINESLQSLRFVKERGLKIDQVLLYDTDHIEDSSKDKYMSRAIAKIQNEMTDEEQILVQELCKRNKLDDENWLIKDGSIEYNPRFSNLDKTEWDKLRANYQYVVGISKKFDPELIRDYRGKKLSKTIANLKEFERTKVYNYPSPYSDMHYAIWYVRLRKDDYRETNFSDVVKCELVLMNEHQLIDTDRINLITANIIREAYPVCYGSDARWANHLYPVFLTESFCKANYLNSEIILSLF